MDYDRRMSQRVWDEIQGKINGLKAGAQGKPIDQAVIHYLMGEVDYPYFDERKVLFKSQPESQTIGTNEAHSGFLACAFAYLAADEVGEQIGDSERFFSTDQRKSVVLAVNRAKEKLGLR